MTEPTPNPPTCKCGCPGPGQERVCRYEASNVKDGECGCPCHTPTAPPDAAAVLEAAARLARAQAEDFRDYNPTGRASKETILMRMWGDQALLADAYLAQHAELAALRAQRDAAVAAERAMRDRLDSEIVANDIGPGPFAMTTELLVMSRVHEALVRVRDGGTS